MLKGIRDFFNQKIASLKQEEFPDPLTVPAQAKMAACAILLEMACIDGEFAHKELKELALSLQKTFDLSKDQLYGLVELADQELKRSEDIGQFAALVNEHFSAAQKEQLLVLVWQVVMADGKLEKKEERFAKQIMNRLQMSEEALDRAKQRAKESNI